MGAQNNRFEELKAEIICFGMEGRDKRLFLEMELNQELTAYILQTLLNYL